MAVNLFTTSNYVTVSTSGLTSGTWFTADVSASVSADATGVILYVTASSSAFYFRKKGSTDSWPKNKESGFIYVGLNASKQFEVKATTAGTKPTIRLAGYFEEEAVFFDDAIDFSMAAMANNAYNDVDIASSTGGATATMAIVAITWPDTGGSTDYVDAGLRKNGASWTDKFEIGYSAAGVEASPEYSQSYQIVPVDGSEIFEVYRQQDGSGNVGTVKLIGYLTSGITALTSPSYFTSPADTTNFYAFTLTNNQGSFLVYKNSSPADFRTTGGTTRDNESFLGPVIGNSSKSIDLKYWSLSASYQIGQYLLVSMAPVKPPAGTLALSGNVPTIQLSISIAPPAGTLTLSGLTPVINTGATTKPPLNTIALASFAPTIRTGASAQPSVAVLTLTAPTPVVETPVEIRPPLGLLSLGLPTPLASAGVRVDIPLKTIALASFAPVVSGGASVYSPAGTLTLVADAPEVRGGISVLVPLATLELVAQPIIVSTGVNIVLDEAQLNLTGKRPFVNARPKTWYAALNGRSIEEVFIILVTISHADLTDDIRVANDTLDDLEEAGVKGVYSQALEFIYVPFTVILPNLQEGVVPVSKLSIDNVSREIIEILSSLRSPADLRIQIALSTDADIIEYDLQGLKLSAAPFNELTVEAEFSAEYFLNEPYPSTRFTPSRFPGVFRGRSVVTSV